MISVCYLLCTDSLIVERTVCTGRVTAGIYKYLALFLVWYLFENIELVIEIIVDDNNMIVLTDLGIKGFGIGYTLAGRACELEVWIVLSYVILKDRGHNDAFVKTVVGDVHYHVAEFIAEVLFLYHRIGECKAERNALFIEVVCNTFYKVFMAHTVHNSSAVPERWRKYAVDRSYLYTFAEKFGTVLHHCEENCIELKETCKIGQMKSYFHCITSLFQPVSRHMYQVI